jgi:hypothetical protein
VEIKRRIREVVHERVPAGATVVIVSRGDDDLLEFDARHAWHFPQTKDRVYAGHYPADSHEAIAQLERLHGEGAKYLLLPRTSFWWLDHYAGLRQHLESSQARVAVEDDACMLFELHGTGPSC